MNQAEKTASNKSSGERVRNNLQSTMFAVQILAFLSIAGYFLYKTAAGWTEVTMSLDIVTNRVHDPADKNQDILGITVKLKNGNWGKIRLSDAVATVKYDTVTLDQKLEGIVRYEIEDGKVIPGRQAIQTPSRTGLGPNQEILLSTYARVPAGKVCIIDVTVVAKRLLKRVYREARSAAVSIPID